MSSPNALSGFVVVDKPSEWTSHDVVARLRKALGTKKVGHAGTLDPMATGVLLIGVGGATRLLGRISESDKQYEGTIRLGATTTTDDAQGEIVSTAPKGWSVDGLAQSAVEAAVEQFVGDILQRPSSVSAIKVDGKRAYARVRAGEDVKLAERPVTVSQFEVLNLRHVDDGDHSFVDVDVVVTCSSGTYIRALARDVGAALGCGGHLTALRRTRVGPYWLDVAVALNDVTRESVVDLRAVCEALFPLYEATAEEAGRVSHGNAVAWPSGYDIDAPVAIVSGSNALALAEHRDGQLAPVVVWAHE